MDWWLVVLWSSDVLLLVVVDALVAAGCSGGLPMLPLSVVSFACVTDVSLCIALW